MLTNGPLCHDTAMGHFDWLNSFSMFNEDDITNIVAGFTCYNTTDDVDPTMYVPRSDSDTELEVLKELNVYGVTPVVTKPREILLRGEDSQENISTLVDVKSKVKRCRGSRSLKRKKFKKKRTTHTTDRDNFILSNTSSIFFTDQLVAPRPVTLRAGELFITEEDRKNLSKTSAKYKWTRPFHHVTSTHDNDSACFSNRHMPSSLLNNHSFAIAKYGHADTPRYIIPRKEHGTITDCKYKICCVCTRNYGDCNPAKGICRIPVNACDSGKHMICFSCFYIYCLCVEPRHNDYTHCACPGCNDYGKTRIRAFSGYSKLCKITMNMRGPPTTIQIQEFMEHLSKNLHFAP